MPPDRTRRLRARLSTFGRDDLITLLLDAAERDPALARRLTLAAARDNGDLAALRDAVRSAFASSGSLEYWPAIRYAQGASDVADALADLVRAGRARDALPLIERAIAALLAAVGRADDSAGALGDLMRRLLRMHAEAVVSARLAVEPLALARWIIEYQLGGQDWFTVDIADYAEALGDEGLALYRREVHARWRAKPGGFAIRHAKEGLARLDRDVPALVEVVGGDLKYAAQYGRLARALRDIGEDEAAIDWAERGLRRHPEDPPGAGLRDFLVEAYLTRDGSTALRLRREGLATTPVLHAYTALRTVARNAGRWEAERPSALAVLARHNPADHVRALLAEDDVDSAWRVAQKTPALAGSIWDELTRRRATTDPAGVVDVMRRRIDEVLAGSGRGVYRDAVRRLHQLREVCARCGRADDFDLCIRELTARHRRRPALLAELARAGLC